jgi:hypothetical protein
MRRTWIAVSLVAAVVMIVALPAWAKGGGGGGSTISLVIPNAAAAATSSGPQSPSFGQQVTFAESTTATAYPWVDAKCSQNGKVVYEQFAGFYSGYTGSQMFTLGPTQMWSGGAASCTAALVSYDKNGSPRTLATTSFTVSG